MAQDNKPQDPFRFEREMAIAILNKRDSAALQALKQFLMNMSAPKAIETVLAQAVCNCAEVHPEAFAWILAEADQLEPELSLEQWAQHWVETCLGQQRVVVERESGGEQQAHKPRLSLEEQALQLLQENSSHGEWLLINQLFEIDRES